MLETFFQPLFDKIRLHPQSLALITPEDRWTFGRLGAAVSRFLRVLAGLPDGLILIHGHKEPEAVAAMIAAIWSGRGYVFADVSNPPSRLESIARISDARAVISLSAAAPELPLPVWRFGSQEEWRDTGEILEGLPAVPGDRTLYLTFTSGSTGTPKGVRISRKNYASFLSWFGPLCDTCQGHGGGHVNHANFAFDMSASDLWPALCGGRAVYLLDHRNNINPRATLRHLLKDRDAADEGTGHGPGSWTSTPAFLSMMLSDPAFCARELPSLKTFFVGGEQVNRAMLTLLRKRFPGVELLHGYGPSEATCITHCHALSDKDLTGDGPLPLGRVQGGMQVRILGPDGNPVPGGELGEIELAGAQVSPGYLPAGHPGNLQVFGGSGGEGRSYLTGDYGWLGEDDCLYVEGRRDGQVKWNGNRIETGEIERVALEFGPVENAVVLVERGLDNQVRSLQLAVQSARQIPDLAGQVAGHLKVRLPASYCPRAIHVVERLPLTMAGKVDRQKLASLLFEAEPA